MTSRGKHENRTRQLSLHGDGGAYGETSAAIQLQLLGYCVRVTDIRTLLAASFNRSSFREP